MMNKLKNMKMSTLVIAMIASNAIHGVVTTLLNKNEAAIVHGFTNKIFITLVIGYLMVIGLNFVDKFIYGAFKTREINNQHIKILRRVTGSKMSDIQQIASGKIFDTVKDIAATTAMMKVSMAFMLYSTIPFMFLIIKELKAAPAAAVVSIISIPLSVGLILGIEKKLKFTEEQKKNKSVMQGICADNFVNRPAINVGISVSRVGGSAQVKSMKKVAGTLKIDQAQYRELESFSKFSSDMDTVTSLTIDKGRKNNVLLIQPQYAPMPVGEQVAILYCGTNALMRDIPLSKVPEFQKVFLDRMRSEHRADVLDPLARGKIDSVITDTIEHVAAEIVTMLNNA